MAKNNKQDINGEIIANALKYRKPLQKRKVLTATAIALTAGAAVITPTVVYLKNTSEYEVVVNPQLTDYMAYTVKLTRGSTIANLKEKLNAIDGHILVGIYKDSNCTIEYLDTDKVSRNSKVYLKYATITYDIKMSEDAKTAGGMFDIIPASGTDMNSIKWGDTFTFRVQLNEGYETSEYVVQANGETLTDNGSGWYSVVFATDNIEIDVELLTFNLTFSFSNTPWSIGYSQDGEGMYATNQDGEFVINMSEVVEPKIKKGDVLTVYYWTSVTYQACNVKICTINGEPIENYAKITVTDNINLEFEGYLKLGCQLSVELVNVNGVEGYLINGFVENHSNTYCSIIVDIPQIFNNRPIFGLSKDLVVDRDINSLENIVIPEWMVVFEPGWMTDILNTPIKLYINNTEAVKSIKYNHLPYFGETIYIKATIIDDNEDLDLSGGWQKSGEVTFEGIKYYSYIATDY